MIEITLLGCRRFLVAGGPVSPSNSNEPNATRAVVQAGMIPGLPVEGIHWTGHQRPRRPLNVLRVLKHLWLVK